MHRLQQHILSQLIHHDCRRYNELKPTDVESNLFIYHLRAVIRAGWVMKRDDGRYQLTSEGMRYADSLSLQTFTPRAQPRLVTLVVCQNAEGQYLFVRRSRQPLLGYATFPYGKIHLGESVGQAAAREMREKTGLSAQLTHRGDGYITIFQEHDPVSEIFFHLFIANNISGHVLAQTKAGEVFWGTPYHDDKRLMPSVMDLINLVETSERFFFAELTYRLPREPSVL